MMPANVGEYFRSKGTPMDVLEMKRKFIREMTNGKRDSLTLPNGIRAANDIEVPELTEMNLINIISMYTGYRIGQNLVNDMAGL